MATNVSIDPELIEGALIVSGERTRKVRLPQKASVGTIRRTDEAMTNDDMRDYRDLLSGFIRVHICITRPKVNYTANG